MIIKDNMFYSIMREAKGQVWLNWPYTVDEGNRTITIFSVDEIQLKLPMILS